MRKANTRRFYRTLYAGELETITLFKRFPDQAEGDGVSVVIFNARKSSIATVGQQIQGDMQVGTRVKWHLFKHELERATNIATGQRVVIWYISPADYITDKYGRQWQPESDSQIDIRLFENEVHFDCHRRDPTGANIQTVW